MREQKAEESKSRRLGKRKNEGTDEAFALAEEQCRMESEICYLALFRFDDNLLSHLTISSVAYTHPVFHRPLSDSLINLASFPIT